MADTKIRFFELSDQYTPNLEDYVIAIDKDGNPRAFKVKLIDLFTAMLDVPAIQDIILDIVGGGGGVGPQGPAGPAGSPGTKWFTVGAPIPSPGQFPGAIAGDLLLSSQGAVWEHDGTDWQYGPINLMGPQGVQGIQGDTGATGATGQDGPGATISVGSVTAGSPCSVVNVGTARDAIFNIVLETGATGATGAQGIQGEQGIQGIQGEQGIQGIQGIQGEAGPNAISASTTTSFSGFLFASGGLITDVADGEDATIDLTSAVELQTIKGLVVNHS